MDLSVVYLKRVSDGKLVEATLVEDITAEHAAKIDDEWIPLLKAAQATLEKTNAPEDAHWVWSKKIRSLGIIGRRACSIHRDGSVQGALIMDLANIGPSGGRSSLYVDFLATAPWNRPEIQKPHRFKGVGRILIAAAIHVSLAEGFKGRIALHSLPQAEAFYKNIVGMTVLGSDPTKQNLKFYELSSKGADAFLNQFH